MYLLRVYLPDTPGSLGAVASALGELGADIVAVDVVERQPDGTAVDDFLVELPLGGRADTLVSACQSVDDVRVGWLSHYAQGRDLRRDLEAVEAMTEQPRRAEKLLVDLLPDVFRADWTMLTSLTGPESDKAAVVHSSTGAPDLPDGVVPWLPATRPTRVELPSSWDTYGWREVTAAAVPLGGPRRALVTGRRGGPEFLDSELARLGHLAALAITIAQSAPRGKGTTTGPA